MNHPPRRIPLLALALLALGGSACTGTRTLTDPTVRVRTSGGSELGVSTEYGVVFLGRTAQSGRAEVTAWFGDGPSIESGLIEPVGTDLYTAEMEIRLPEVGLSFDEPRPGTEVLVIGRRGGETWERDATVRSDPRVEGILLSPIAEIERSADQIGAGVYVLQDGDADRKRLLGLVSGILRLEGEGGRRVYMTVVGPRDLWRLVAHRRELQQRRRWVYREDIL